MAPVVQTSTALAGAAAANAVVTLPSGIQDRDIVLVTIYKENTNAVTTVPAGFAEKGTAPTTTAPQAQHTFWKRMSGGETGTITFAWTGSVFRAASAVRISGCASTGDPIEGINSNSSNTSVATLSTSLAATSADTLLYFAATDFTGGNAWAPPSGYTEINDLDVLGDDWKTNAAGGATGSIASSAGVSGPMTVVLLDLLSATTAAQQDSAETFLPDATLFDSSGVQPLGFMYQPTPEQVLDPVAAPAAPGFAPQSPNRSRHLWRFRSRSAQPTLAQLEVPPLPAVRNARPLLRRGAARMAGPVPDQVTPPTTPSVVPGITTRRPRWLRRRSESAQPVPTQEAAPTNPPIAFLTRARRVLFSRRLSDAAEAPLEQPTPPAQAHPRRPVPRLRASGAAAPIAEQPAVSAPLERRRLVVRRRSGRAATPTPTQQAAPQNPDFSPLNRERARRLIRRGAGRTATPTPVQQAAPSNPEIVSAVRALRRRMFRRGPGRTAAPVPAQQAAPANPAIVFVTRAFRPRTLSRGNARTASPVPAQAAPANPPFVPAGLRRPRRALRKASHVATPPVDQLAPLQTPPAPLRSLLRRARRRIAQAFVFVAPPLGRFITVEVVVGDDRYQIEVGDDRYQVGVGDADHYEVMVGDDRYQVGVGEDRYEIEVE